MEGGHEAASKAEFTECWHRATGSPYIMRLALSAGIGGLLFGYDTGTLPIHKHTPFQFCCDSDSDTLINRRNWFFSSKLSHIYNIGVISGALLYIREDFVQVDKKTWLQVSELFSSF